MLVERSVWVIDGERDSAPHEAEGPPRINKGMDG